MTPENTLPYVVYEVAGKEERWKKLSINDIYLHLLPAEKKRRKDKMIENLKLIGATPDQMFSELERFEDQSLDFDDYIKLLNSIPGAISIVQYAYEGDKSQPLDLSITDVVAIIRKLCEGTGI